MMLSLLAAFTLCGSSLAAPPQRGPVLVVAQPQVRDAELRAIIDAWLDPALGQAAAGGLELALVHEDEADSPEGELRPGFPTRQRIVARERAPLETRELGAAVRSARAIALSGGRFVDWYETLFPSDGPARLAHALYEAHMTGVPIVAFGGVGSFVSGAGMVPRAEFDRPQRDPHEDVPNAALMGLAVGARAVVDAPSWSVGDPLELLRALHETKVDLGFFLEGEVAILCDPDARRVRVLGPGRVLLFDLDGARRPKRGVWEGRVSVLRRGDVIDLRYQRVLPAEGRRPAAADAGLPAGQSLCDQFLSAGESARSELTLGEPAMQFELHRDEDTRRLVDDEGRRTLIDLAFDLSWE